MAAMFGLCWLCCRLFLIFNSLWVSCVLVLILTLAVIRIRQGKDVSKVLAFPQRLEKFPLVRQIILHRSFMKTMKDTGVDYSVLFLNYLFGEARQFRAHGLYAGYLASQANVVIFRADHVEKLLNNSVNIAKGEIYDLLFPWMGQGLLTSSGKKWKTRRRMLTPAFHFQILAEFANVFNRNAANFVERLSKKKPDEDIAPYVSAVTLDIVQETIMGVKAHSEQTDTAKHYLNSIKVLGELFFRRVQSPLNWIPLIYKLTADGRKTATCLRHVHEFTLKVIRDRKRELQQNPEELEEIASTENSILKSKRPFLDLLLVEHMRDKSLTLEDIREEVDTFMFEGHDTTSLGLTWAIYLIGLHPDVQEKLLAEIDQVFGGDHHCDVTEDHLKKLKYLDITLKESQRLYPSVPFISRKTTDKFELLGKVVPVGTEVTIDLTSLHGDPEVFPKPELFIPERFLPENCVGRSAFAFVPFSAGPRNCIGQKFALMEEKIIIAWLLRKFRLKSLVARDELEIVAEMVLRPKNAIRVECCPRIYSESS